MPNSDCVCLLSGGLDSVTLLEKLVQEGKKPLCVSFDYGQRHRKELTFGGKAAEKRGLERIVLPLSLCGESALTRHSDIPMGIPAGDPKQSPTVVPGRNLAMIAMAASVGTGDIYIGCNADDAAVYADCRIAFLKSVNKSILIGYGRELHFPFVELTKLQIYALSKALKIKSTEHWSCYAGGQVPCGQCGPCTAIKEAKDAYRRRS